MKIDFHSMPVTPLEHFCGGEGALDAKMYKDERGKILLGRLEPGSSIGMHTHETSSEAIYILSGTGKVLYDDGSEPLSPSDCHYCPKGHAHSLINDSAAPLEFFAVVSNQ